jgi:hypothetical protein
MHVSLCGVHDGKHDMSKQLSPGTDTMWGQWGPPTPLAYCIFSGYLHIIQYDPSYVILLSRDSQYITLQQIIK